MPDVKHEVQTPQPWGIYYCDFGEKSKEEHRPPEAYKKRPVVILSKQMHNGKMACIIALSSKAPKGASNKRKSYKLEGSYPTVIKENSWAKGELIESVSLCRLSHTKGITRYKLSQEDQKGVKKLILRMMELNLKEK